MKTSTWKERRSAKSIPTWLLIASLFGCADEPSPGDGMPAITQTPALGVRLFSTDVGARCTELVREREQAGSSRSSRPDGVAWAATLDEAFARARAENKPVLLATYVRENGDPQGDV